MNISNFDKKILFKKLVGKILTEKEFNNLPNDSETNVQLSFWHKNLYK